MMTVYVSIATSMTKNLQSSLFTVTAMAKRLVGHVYSHCNGKNTSR